MRVATEVCYWLIFLPIWVVMSIAGGLHGFLAVGIPVVMLHWCLWGWSLEEPVRAGRASDWAREHRQPGWTGEEDDI